MVRIYLLLLLVLIRTVYGQSHNFKQLTQDLSEFTGLGAQYFNTTACFFPSNISSIPVVNINNNRDLLNIGQYRKQYSSKKLVYFQLTSVDVKNISGYYPAYLLSNHFSLFSNMSCSYIRGMGYGVTSILVNYNNITLASNALNIFPSHDLIIADLTIDRTNSSWWTPGFDCSMATNYPNLVPNSAAVLSTPTCLGFNSHKLNLNLPIFTNHAIKVICHNLLHQFYSLF